MADRLQFEERKFILKCYWKNENAVEVQRQLKRGFNKEPPTRVTITRIRDNFKLVELFRTTMLIYQELQCGMAYLQED